MSGERKRGVVIIDGQAVTVISEPKAHFVDMIVFRERKGGKVVGTVDAVFDFENLPPEFHAQALSIIQGMGWDIEVSPRG